jgi:hypothetical protein
MAKKSTTASAKSPVKRAKAAPLIVPLPMIPKPPKKAPPAPKGGKKGKGKGLPGPLPM